MIQAAVVDSSVALKWVVEEPDTPQAESLATAQLQAPDLLLVECANALWKKVIRQELRPSEAFEALTRLHRAPLRLESTRPLLPEALSLAVDINHPIYDCLYLSLARGRDLPLVTADQRFYSAVNAHPGLKGIVLLLNTVQN